MDFFVVEKTKLLKFWDWSRNLFFFIRFLVAVVVVGSPNRKKHRILVFQLSDPKYT